MEAPNTKDKVVVRFPPSPTGFLHVGGARTALFNWLYAKANGGTFLLRLEDTDRERSEDRFVEDIMESLRWLGLNWDGEPVFQSKRIERHKEVAEELVKKGFAYRCDCTPEALDAYRKECQAKKLPYRYPGTCREKKDVQAPYVLRIRVPDTGETRFQDMIRGEIIIPNKDVEDWVLVRSDGNPTYNFVVVVDDHDMGVTHVLRGEDHINNTPKQAMLYEALGFQLPQFAHLPMILGSDRAKLSKRHGAASTLEYRKMGYLPEAMINFLVRLGWSYGDEEVFTVDKLKQVFSVEHIGKANAIFNTEKLDWLNGIYLREKPTAELTDYLWKYFSEDLKFASGVETKTFTEGVKIIQGKVKNIPELIEQLYCLFGDDPGYDMSALKENEKSGAIEIIKDVAGVLEESDFSLEDLEKRIRGYADSKGEKFGKIAKAVRFSLTGGKISPGLFEMISVQGRDTLKRRMERALKALG